MVKTIPHSVSCVLHSQMASVLRAIKPTAEEVKIANKILEASGKNTIRKVVKKTGVGLKYWANSSPEFTAEDVKLVNESRDAERRDY